MTFVLSFYKHVTSYLLRREPLDTCLLTVFCLQVRNIMECKGHGEEQSNLDCHVSYSSTGEVLASQALVNTSICVTQVMILLWFIVWLLNS